MTYIHVQHYNSGGLQGLDGQTYTQGTADFEVALSDMLLNGFPVGNNSNNMFPALNPSQVMIGLPATGPAAPSGGYIAPSEMKKALDYIIKGVSYGGKYKMVANKSYPEFRGLMTWSVNWDAKSNFEFSNNYRSYFDALGPVTPPTPITPSFKVGTLSSSAVTNGSYSVTGTVPANNTATSYKIFEGTNVINSGSLTANNSSSVDVKYNVTNKTSGSYDYTLALYDGTASLTSNKVTVVVPVTPPPTNAAPTLTGVTNKTITIGDTFNALNGVTASDKEDGDLTSKIKVTGTVDTTKAGTYNVTYSVTDNGNLTTTATAVITVKAVTPPSPLDTFDANKIYNAGDKVIYKGVTYTCKWWSQGGTPDTSAAWELYVAPNADGSLPYVAGKAYNGGATVSYNGKVYKANWWTTSVPGSDSSWSLK